MAIVHSKLTAQRPILVPAKVRRVGRYSSEEVHQSLFRTTPKARSLEALKEGVRRHIRKRHASR